MAVKPNVIQQVEKYSFSEDELIELIKLGFMHNTFLSGRAGDGQTTEFSFTFLDHGSSRGSAVVTTLVQAYQERT